MANKEFSHYQFAARDFSAATLRALEARGFFLVGIQMLPDMTSEMPWANAETGYIVADRDGAGSVKTYQEVIALSKAPRPKGVEGVLQTVTEMWRHQVNNSKEAPSLESRSYAYGMADGFARCMDLLEECIRDADKKGNDDEKFLRS